LRREGYRILTAGDPQKGLTLLDDCAVGVIVSDAGMPGMDGAEFLRRAKQLRPACMRIMLSGYSGNHLTPAAIEKAELFKFLTKPWDDGELLETIREAFLRYEAGQSSAN
jgi:DNA-binding NtrC family response regulator